MTVLKGDSWPGMKGRGARPQTSRKCGLVLQRSGAICKSESIVGIWACFEQRLDAKLASFFHSRRRSLPAAAVGQAPLHRGLWPTCGRLATLGEFVGRRCPAQVELVQRPKMLRSTQSAAPSDEENDESEQELHKDVGGCKQWQRVSRPGVPAILPAELWARCGPCSPCAIWSHIALALRQLNLPNDSTPVVHSLQTDLCPLKVAGKGLRELDVV